MNPVVSPFVCGRFRDVALPDPIDPVASARVILWADVLSLPIPLTSPEDRAVQVGNEDVARCPSLVCEPVHPETVCEPIDPEIACEAIDPELVLDPLLVSRSTAKISGMKLPKTRHLLTTWSPS